jgi:hypothetical protein
VLDVVRAGPGRRAAAESPDRGVRPATRRFEPGAELLVRSVSVVCPQSAFAFEWLAMTAARPTQHVPKAGSEMCETSTSIPRRCISDEFPALPERRASVPQRSSG